MNASADEPVVSVVSPMYNEAVNIARAVSVMRASLEQLHEPWEFILVNDGSVDDSLAVAREAVGNDARIRIITYEQNRGRGYALRQGFAAARGRFIVATEADLSWGEDIVHRLLDACREPGADMVVASPHMEGGKLDNVPPYRAFLTSFGNVILRRLMPGGLTMNTGMTRAYRRGVLDAMELYSDGKELHLEIISKAYALGFRMTEIPATLAWTKERRNERRRFRARGLIFSHLAHGFAESPMTVFRWIAAGLFGLAILALILQIVMLAAGSDQGMFMLPTMSVVLGCTGLVALMAGLIGSQIAEVRRELYRVQRRAVGGRSADSRAGGSSVSDEQASLPDTSATGTSTET